MIGQKQARKSQNCGHVLTPSRRSSGSERATSALPRQRQGNTHGNATIISVPADKYGKKQRGKLPLIRSPISARQSDRDRRKNILPCRSFNKPRVSVLQSKSSVQPFAEVLNYQQLRNSMQKRLRFRRFGKKQRNRFPLYRKSSIMQANSPPVGSSFKNISTICRAYT